MDQVIQAICTSFTSVLDFHVCMYAYSHIVELPVLRSNYDIHKTSNLDQVSSWSDLQWIKAYCFTGVTDILAGRVTFVLEGLWF